MPVTEFAILHTLPSSDKPDPASMPPISPAFLTLLSNAQATQAQWCSTNHPNSPSSIPQRGLWAYQQLEDPSAVLLTAHWPDVAAHHASIASPDNQSGMAELAKHMDPSQSVELLHLAGELFDTPAEAGTKSLLESPVVSAARMKVLPARRAEFERTWEMVRGVLGEAARPHCVRSGWRVDGEEGQAEEFVMFCGWESREAHGAFGRSVQARGFQELRGCVVGGEVDVKHYRRVL